MIPIRDWCSKSRSPSIPPNNDRQYFLNVIDILPAFRWGHTAPKLFDTVAQFLLVYGFNSVTKISVRKMIQLGYQFKLTSTGMKTGRQTCRSERKYCSKMCNLPGLGIWAVWNRNEVPRCRVACVGPRRVAQTTVLDDKQVLCKRAAERSACCKQTLRWWERMKCWAMT